MFIVEGKANDNLETYQGLNGGDQMFTNLRRIKKKHSEKF